jgi:hypothetical protein
MKQRGPTLSRFLLPVLIMVSATVIAIFLGGASALLPRVLVIGLGLIMIALPIYLFRPVWLVVPVVVFQLYSPSQPAADVATFLLIARAAVTLAGRWQELRAVLENPIIKALLALGLCVIVSFSVAISVLHVGKSAAYQDGRIYVYLLWIVPFIAWAPKGRHAQWLTNHLLALASIVAVLAVVQGVFGISLVETGRVAQLDTLGRVSADVTRVQIPGFTFVTLGILLCVAQLIWRPPAGRKLVYLALLLLFVVADIYNFGRALWFWTTVGAIVTSLAMGLRASTKMAIWGSVFAIAFGSALITAKPDLARTIVERVTSIAAEGGGRSSYGWREIENQSARGVLADTLLMGTAIGGDYRSPVLGLRAFENHTRYIHNGHLSVLLKLSIFGYISYFILFTLIVRQAWRQRRIAATAAMSCASIGWLFAFIGENITQPSIMSAHGLTALSAIISCLLLSAMRSPVSEKQTVGSSLARQNSFPQHRSVAR